MTRTGPAAGLLAAAGLLLAGVGMAAADFVVLESNVPALAPGAIEPPNRQVALGPGARLVLIEPDGATRLVLGPFTGPLGRAGAPRPSVLERFKAAPRKGLTLGAVRQGWRGGADHGDGAER